MKAEDRENTFFIIFILIVLALAVIYFTVPERPAFIDYQIKWWSEFWE